MSLSDKADPARLTIERWVGQIPRKDIATTETLLAELGAPEAVALQLLTARRGAFVTSSAAASSGKDRADHSKNIDGPLDQQINRLVGYMISNSDSIPLTASGQALLAEQMSGPGGDTETTIIVDTVASYPRRG